MLYFSLNVRKQPDCRGGFGTVSARLRESKAQWPTFRAACLCVWVGERVRVSLSMCACVCECIYVCDYIHQPRKYFHRCWFLDVSLPSTFTFSWCFAGIFARADVLVRHSDGVWGRTVIFWGLFCLQCQLLRDSLRLGASLPLWTPTILFMFYKREMTHLHKCVIQWSARKPVGQIAGTSKLIEQFSVASLVSLLASNMGCRYGCITNTCGYKCYIKHTFVTVWHLLGILARDFVGLHLATLLMSVRIHWFS